MSQKIFWRKVRNQNEPDWDAVEHAWRDLTKQDIKIDFKGLFSEIVKFFKASPVCFIQIVKKSHHLPKGIPENFDALTLTEKAKHLFAQFRFLFNFNELKEFVNRGNMVPESFKSHFSPSVATIFESICWLYQTMLYSIESTPMFDKVASDLILCFGKLLVPNDSRHLTSTSFHLDNVYISPVFVDMEGIKHQPGFFMVQEDGGIVLVDATSKLIRKIEAMTLTGLVRDDKLIFDDEFETVLEIQFPSSEAASNALMFSLTPPPRGFMQLTAFLHSIPAFENLKTFFPAGEAKFPEEFNNGLRACMSADTMELLLYAFTVPPKEARVVTSNLDFFIDHMSDSIVTFSTVLLHIYWSMAPFEGHLVFRQNSQMTAFFSTILKVCCADYISLVSKEFMRTIEENVSKIQAEVSNDVLITDDHDAEAFIDHIFKPFIDWLFKSIDQMPPILRFLHRIAFVRTSGFYVNQCAAFLVVPNLLLLRILLPPIAEDTMRSYCLDPKKRRLASLLSGSLLAMFYGMSWPEDKEPYMSKYKEYMKRMFKTAIEFTSRLIDCSSMTFDKDKFTNSGDPIAILKGIAERVILMNLGDPNKVIHSHPYCVSLMQMIEEYVYDFKDFIDVQDLDPE